MTLRRFFVPGISRGRAAAWLARGASVLMLAWVAGTQTAAAQGASDDPRLSVVASFSILGDIVRQVGGDDIQLDVLVGPMRDAHTFEPTPKDARALGHAQVLVVNGLGFESWMPRLVEAAGFQGRTLVASQGVQARRLGDDDEDAHAQGHGHADHGHDHGDVDPHAWQDLSNGVIYARNIAQGLAEADPAHAAAYRSRAEAYVQTLQQADAEWRRQLDAIPVARRVLATSHDAFGYFGQAYGIEVLSVVGLSSEAEPSARTMADLATRIREHHIRALFLEQGGNTRALQQIAQETGVKLGGTLYADTLEAPGHDVSTYLGMFRWNTRQLLAAFQAP